uniref:NADH dehydrogenase subunit 2 n=1 Tax=Hippocampus bargibanti TaxID=240838 RepID=UPI00211E54F7|nr:NADH dehydrogenase subunit 2 [Hippocampus bargibanti]UTV00997.1 NADH dehydrogenase subunit 2 [Hippocampus bargibanti]
MNPYIMLIFLLGLSLGTMITIMSSHWLLAWMGLEINTLAIIPLMAQHHHPRSVEASTKYFLTQATAAAMILFASSTNAWMTGQWVINEMNHPLPMMIMTLGLALKIGIAPLHTWMPEVLQGLDLTTGLIMSTWQKLAPFSLLLQMNQNNSMMLTIMAMMSVVVGGWGGLNQTQLRKILAYSSIAHIGWMILIVQYYPKLMLMTLIIYILMTFSIFNTFKLMKSTSISTLATSWSKHPTITAITPLLLLSLGGLPPLTGFGPKWLILSELTKQDLNTMAVIMALSALLSLYFYLRLSYAVTLTISPNTTNMISQWNYNIKKPSQHLSTTTALSLLLLPLLPSIFTIMI